jgi:hypothetical protein
MCKCEHNIHTSSGVHVRNATTTASSCVMPQGNRMFTPHVVSCLRSTECPHLNRCHACGQWYIHILFTTVLCLHSMVQSHLKYCHIFTKWCTCVHPPSLHKVMLYCTKWYIHKQTQLLQMVFTIHSSHISRPVWYIIEVLIQGTCFLQLQSSRLRQQVARKSANHPHYITNLPLPQWNPHV